MTKKSNKEDQKTEKITNEKTEISKKEGEEEEPEIKDETPTIEEEPEIEPPPKEEVEEEILEEKFYTIPLGKAWIAPSNKRAARAIRIIKDFIIRHMKLREKEEFVEGTVGRLIISNDVNERIWSRGIKKPPRKVRVRATRDGDDNVIVYLAEGD
jgi:large subunit ribosomal protein L31e